MSPRPRHVPGRFLSRWSSRFSVFGFVSVGGVFAVLPCPAQTADLSIAKRAEAPTGGNLIYTLTISNSGPNTATNVMLSDPLPAQVSFVTLGQGNCTLAPANVATNSFTPAVNFPAANQPSSVALDDLDADGKPDLIYANFGSNSLSIRRNTSTRGAIDSQSFGARVDFATAPQPYAIAPGDLNGDCKPDLVVAAAGTGTTGFVSVLRNTSSSGVLNSSAFAPRIDLPAGRFTIAVAIGDLDGDNKPDLAAANYLSNTVSIFRNTTSPFGTGTSVSFSTKVDYATAAGPAGVVIADLNGDGKPEVVGVNFSSGSISIYRNNSSPGAISFAPRTDLSASGGPWDVAVGDLDGDNRPDLAVANLNAQTVSIFRNTGNITFASRIDFAAEREPVSIALAYLNGDGKADLAIANNATNIVCVLENRSTPGTISSNSFAPKINFIAGNEPSDVATGDIDGDGKAELAVANQADNTVSISRNTTSPGTLTCSLPDLPSGAAEKITLEVQPNGSGLISNSAAVTSSTTDPAPANNSSAVNFLVSSPNIGPAITQHPASAYVNQGAYVVLSVRAVGAGPLQYQWRLNGVNIPGATNFCYIITNAQVTNGGAYEVVVANPFGVVNSNPALLLFNDIPVLQPGDNFAGRVSLPATACAGNPPAYSQLQNFEDARRSDTENDPPPPQSIADDFTLLQPAPIALIRWWGTYVNGLTSDMFSVRIWNDSNGVPGGIVWVAQGTVSAFFTSSNIIGTASPEFRYELTLSNPFTGQTGVVYWLEIVNNRSGPSYWLWESSFWGNGRIAQTHSGFWQQMSGDQAFELVPGGGVAQAGLVRGDNFGATKQPGEPHHAGKPGGKSVWYAWQAPCSGIATFHTVGSAFDTLLAAYTGFNVSTLTHVASDEDRGGFHTSKLRFNAMVGAQYQIAVDGHAAAENHFVLSWQLERTSQRLPVILANPISQTITQNASYTFTVSATHALPLTYQWFFNGAVIPGAASSTHTRANIQPAHVGNYSVTVTVTGLTNLWVESLSATLEIGPLPEVRSRDKMEDLFLSASVPESLFSSGFPSVAMGIPSSQLFSTVNASISLGECPCGVIGSNSKWFGVQGGAKGTFRIDTLRSTFDTVLAVYRNTNWASLCANRVGCDNNSAPDGIRSLVRFETEANQEYLVVVDGVNGATGQVGLNFYLGIPPRIASALAAQSTNVPYGGSLTLNARFASANPPASYQWYRGGQAIAGATNDVLTITNIRQTDAGPYSVVASNFIIAVVNSNAVISVIATDYGDAPPAYPTASHLIQTGFHLGATIDGESAEPKTSDALGDDTTLHDDEDGVVIGQQSTLLAGQAATVEVNASANGRLDAWIDFNRANGWLDPGEQIFTSRPLTQGLNTLSFLVPGTAAPGNTFARFRFSANGGLGFTGPAANGEVEDYLVTNKPVADLSLTQHVAPDPVAVGNPLTFTLQISNAGPSTASQVMINQSWTGPAVLNSATSCSNSVNQINCSIDQLAPGSVATVSVVVIPTASGTITSSATVQSSAVDLQLGNNTATISASAYSTPVFTRPPMSQTAPAFAELQFHSAATQSPSYQWLSNGVPIGGATNSTLILSNVLRSAIAFYSVVASNVAGSITSAPAELQLLLTRHGAPLPMALARDSREGLTEPLYRGVPCIFTTLDASREPGEINHCAQTGGHSKWVYYRAPYDELLTVSSDGSDFQTVLAVYTTPESTPIACSTNRVVQFQTVAGTNYYIVVDGVDGATGIARLQVGGGLLHSPSRLPNGAFQFWLTGHGQRSYQLGASIDLLTWETLLQTNVPAAMIDWLLLYSQDPAPAEPSKFYRADELVTP